MVNEHEVEALKERLTVLEWLLSAAIYGPNLDNPQQLKRIGEQLAVNIEAGYRSKELSLGEFNLLRRHVDSLCNFDTERQAELGMVHRDKDDD